MCGSWRADPNVSVARYSGDPRGGHVSLSGLTVSKSELLHHCRLQLDHGWASQGFLCVLWRAVDATIAPGAHALRGSGYISGLVLLLLVQQPTLAYARYCCGRDGSYLGGLCNKRAVVAIAVCRNNGQDRFLVSLSCR